MGKRLILPFLAATAVVFLAAETPVLRDLGNLIRQTFSPGGELMAELPIVVSLPSPVAAVPPVSVLPASPEMMVAIPPLSVRESPPVVPVGNGDIRISELMVGAEGNVKYEFIELYNPSDAPADLTGYSVRKRSSTGSESSFVAAARLEGIVVPPGRYLLLAGGGGYDGAVAADVLWPASYSLAAKKNAVVVYDAAGAIADEASWSEIPPGRSLVRTSWSGGQFGLTADPTPQNSQSL